MRASTREGLRTALHLEQKSRHDEAGKATRAFVWAYRFGIGARLSLGVTSIMWPVALWLGNTLSFAWVYIALCVGYTAAIEAGLAARKASVLRTAGIHRRKGAGLKYIEVRFATEKSNEIERIYLKRIAPWVYEGPFAVYVTGDSVYIWFSESECYRVEPLQVHQDDSNEVLVLTDEVEIVM